MYKLRTVATSLIFCLGMLTSCTATSHSPADLSIPPHASRTQVHVIRLRPGDDLKRSLQKFVADMSAGAIVTCVGSLKHAAIRLANQKETRIYEDKFEIVSLTGTLSQDGLHLHIALSDSEGKTIGGHLAEGCTVYTTAEIVVAAFPDLRFTREQDAQTGFRELCVYPVSP